MIMFATDQFFLFLVATWALILTPGPDTIYVVTRGVAGGRTAGLMSALGCASGLLVHTMFAGLGLSLILSTSATAFLVVKYAGAAYLIYLGISSLLSGRKTRIDAKAKQAKPLAIYRQGLLTNVLNPKVALFFLAFLPQFVAAPQKGAPLAVITLGLVFTGCALCWKICLGLFAGGLGDFIAKRPAIMQRIRQISGAVMILLGLRLAVGRE